MGIRLVQGTTFTDTSAGANQVIINAGFARKHWGDRIGGRSQAPGRRRIRTRRPG